MKRIFSILFALVLVLSFSLIPAAPAMAQPDVVWVDDDFTSATPTWGTTHFDKIQDGVDAVATGGTVYVAAGMYDAFDANKDGITVKATSGAEIAANPITVDGQVNAIVVSAHNVTIDGFTIDDPLFSTGIKIYDATTPPYGAVIKNNVIDFTGFDPNTMGSTWAGACIQVKAGSSATTIIEDNNVAFDAADTWGYEGIASWGMHDADVIIRGNTVDISSTGAVNKYHNGITLHGTAASAGGPGSALIDNNTVRVVALGAGMWRHYGIYILGLVSGEYLNNVTITNNTVTGPGYCSWAGKSTGYALRMSGPDTNHIDIMYNDFRDYEFGMVVENNASLNNVHVNYNSIVGNDHGIVIHAYIADVSLDAENNWWGDCSGPSGVGSGSGDSVSANVDYDPWLGQQLCALKVAITALSTDEDFTKPKAASGPNGQKQALLDKVDAVCDQYGDGAYRGALNKLERDITRAIERWIVDDEKTALIDMVEAEISILNGFLQ